MESGVFCSLARNIPNHEWGVCMYGAELDQCSPDDWKKLIQRAAIQTPSVYSTIALVPDLQASPSPMQ